MYAIRSRAGISCAFNHKEGYTLLEVLVALIVTSLFLTMMMPATLGALKRTELDAKKDKALVLARSRMEWLAALPAVVTGVTQGNEGDLQWEITVTDMHVNRMADSDTSGLALKALKVRVMEPGNGPVLAAISAQRLYVLR